MKVSELIEALKLKLITRIDYTDREVTGCYIGDILTRVLSHAKPCDAWITVQTGAEITKVAAATDVACIIIPEGITVDVAVVEKADENGIIILGSCLDSYGLAVGIGRSI
ncbi:MAG: DRTGG domain protein [Firmicutes bacterium ADurb.Bin193]|nr:MAG: DRTGG domain protein [Firmicutes bacterium ADurb.Bin193]